MHIVIVGGSGNFGGWYARFFNEIGFDVTITGRHSRKLKAKAGELGVRWSKDNRGAASQGDVVILSTPIDSIPALIKELAPALKPGSLLADFSSVKENACRALGSVRRRDVELASLHPLHGPRVESLKGMTILAVPVRTNGKYEMLKRVFRGEGAKVVEVSAREHDEAMAVVQGLSHFIAIAGGAALRKTGGRQFFSTPASELVRLAIARVVLQDPLLYASIQTQNPLNKKYRGVFLKEAARIAELADAGRKNELRKKIGECAGIFSDRRRALEESDAAVKAIVKTRELGMKLKKLGVLGPPGTFSDLAAKNYERSTGAPREKLYFRSIPEIFEAVGKGVCEEGVVPVENMIEGTVTITLDSLFYSKLMIKQELVVPIHQCLAALRGSRLKDVERVFSHPNALAQCRGWLHSHIPEAELIEASSTSEAMHAVASQKMHGDAAIGPEVAAGMNELQIIARDIEDESGNVTRFFVVSKADSKQTGNDKTSIALQAYRDRPGLLHDILEAFSSRGINLTKLESRPSKKRLGTYVFYIDVEGHREQKLLKEALAAVGKIAVVKVLGSYPKKT
jgi:prephenate dehydratase